MKEVIHNLSTSKNGMFYILLFMLTNILFLACGQEKKWDDVLEKMVDLPEAGRQAAAERWLERQSAFPLIEDSTVVFIYRNSRDIPVFLTGDFNGWSDKAEPFLKIIGTDIYYRRHSFRADARVEYKIIAGEKWLLDSLNHNVAGGGFGPNSVLFMPQYRFPREMLRLRNKTYTKLDTVIYKAGGLEYRAYVYRHPKATEQDPFLIFNDGGDYIRFGQATVIMDNLIREGRLPALNALFVDPRDRMLELRFDDDYLKRLLREIVPACLKQYALRPSHIYMGGASLGGLTALYALRDHGAMLEGLFSQSGSFWVDSLRIVKALDGAAIKGKKIYLSYGLYESQDENQKKTVNFLKEQQARLKVQAVADGHNWGNWSGTLGSALRFLLSAGEK